MCCAVLVAGGWCCGAGTLAKTLDTITMLHLHLPLQMPSHARYARISYILSLIFTTPFPSLPVSFPLQTNSPRRDQPMQKVWMYVHYAYCTAVKTHLTACPPETPFFLFIKERSDVTALISLFPYTLVHYSFTQKINRRCSG